MEKRRILENYEYVSDFDPDCDSLIGCEKAQKLLESAIADDICDKTLGISQQATFLLVGPAGCGKTYLADFFGIILYSSCDYQTYEVDCEDIISEENSHLILKDLFEEMVEQSNPNGEESKKIYIKIENLSAIYEDKKSIKAIEKGLKRLKKQNCSCIVIASERENVEIPGALLKEFIVVKMELPSEEERTQYWKQKLVFHMNVQAESTEDSVEDSWADAWGNAWGDSEEETEEEEEEESTENTFSFYLCVNVPGEDQKEMDEEDENKVELITVAEMISTFTEGFSFENLDELYMLMIRNMKVRLLEFLDGEESHMLPIRMKENHAYYLTLDEVKDMAEEISYKRELSKKPIVMDNQNAVGGAMDWAQLFATLKMATPYDGGQGAVGTAGTIADKEKEKLFNQLDENNPNPSVEAIVKAASIALDETEEEDAEEETSNEEVTSEETSGETDFFSFW